GEGELEVAPADHVEVVAGAVEQRVEAPDLVAAFLLNCDDAIDLVDGRQEIALLRVEIRFLKKGFGERAAIRERRADADGLVDGGRRATVVVQRRGAQLRADRTDQRLRERL